MLGIPRFCALASFLVLGGIAHAQSSQGNDVWDALNRLSWQFDGTGRIGEIAQIAVPDGHAFLGAADTKRFLELNRNIAADNQYAIAPKDLRWFGIFRFDDSGYVRDDEKLDPDALLEELKQTNRASQEERKRRGIPILTLEGWFVEPHYDLQTKRLEWGTRLRTESNDVVVNYTIKLLGRRGVMNAILVSDPGSLSKDTREFKSALTGYSFNAGEGYAEFRSGDKIAEYGLSALVLGGAAAAAAKAGAFKGMAKLLGLAAIGALGLLGAGLRKVFRRAG
jgi:uncharacterized membrane-anchored protein